MPTSKKATAKAEPQPKFMHIGKGKYVHVFRTKAWDIKHSECPQVRRATVAGKINYKAKGLSPEAALTLDNCAECGVDEIAKRIIKEAETPEDRKARAQDRRDEVLERAAGKAKKTSKAPKGKGEASISGGTTKPKKPSMTKAGVRSVASSKDGDPSKTKAQLLADHGEQHGWAVTIEQDEHGWNVIAKRGPETIWAPFVDGKFDETRYGTLTVGTWTGKLRAAHACRRQMSCEGRDRPFPEPGKGRTGSRSTKAEVVAEDESPEDAARRVPFSIDDDGSVIIDIIKGRVIKWRNGTANKVEEGWVPARSKRTQINEHPKHPGVPGARILSFFHVDSVNEHGEQYGPERHVRLDKIIRVV